MGKKQCLNEKMFAVLLLSYLIDFKNQYDKDFRNNFTYLIAPIFEEHHFLSGYFTQLKFFLFLI